MKKYIKTEIIEKFISEKGISKTKFCKLCKISPSTFKKIMSNETNFSIISLFRVARFINKNICEIVY